MSARVILLCEDLQLACFIRRFLKLRGFGPRDIREQIAPPGQGSGEQWVRNNYPKQLEALRAYGGNAVLIVGTDADNMEVAERVRSLDLQCKEQGVAERGADDPVLMIVPKRNIETWFAYLRGETANETDSYPRYGTESECREDVRSLDGMCRSQVLRPPAPPSLAAACDEYKKWHRFNK